jgi:hypothetical protein
MNVGKWLLGVLMIALNVKSHAQVYREALGVRLTENNVGVSLVERLGNHLTVEGIGQKTKVDINLSASIRIHKNLIGNRLNWYFGGGAQVGFMNNSNITYRGVHAVLGAEYKMILLPVLISVDMRPMFNFYPYPNNLPLEFGLGIRYVTKKDEKKNIKNLLPGGNNSKKRND